MTLVVVVAAGTDVVDVGGATVTGATATVVVVGGATVVVGGATVVVGGATVVVGGATVVVVVAAVVVVGRTVVVVAAAVVVVDTAVVVVAAGVVAVGGTYRLEICSTNVDGTMTSLLVPNVTLIEVLPGVNWPVRVSISMALPLAPWAPPFTVESAKFVGKSGNKASDVVAYSPAIAASPWATNAVSDDAEPTGGTM